MKTYSSLITDKGGFFRRGFSLVEVALAIAIMSLGIVVVVGLLPSATGRMRSAANETAIARIMQTLTGELDSADWGTKGGGSFGWSKIGNYHDLVRQFDDQGLALATTTSSSTPVFASYTTRVTLDVSPVRVPIQGTPPSATVPSQPMLYALIEVATAGDPAYDFTNPQSDHIKRGYILTRQF